MNHSDDEGSADRFQAQLKFVLDSLPDDERIVAELIWRQTPDQPDDSREIRMRQLIEACPDDRSRLIEAWRRELRLHGAH